MLITPLLIKHLLPELRQAFLGARIISIRHQPESKQLILVSKASSGANGLLVNYDSKSYHLRILTDSQIRRLDFPKVENLLAQLLEATIETIEQVDFDRVLKFSLSQFDQLWGRRTFFLYCEISANLNLILTDSEQIILNSLKSTPGDSASRRKIRAGENYALPARPAKLDSHYLNLGQWKNLLHQHPHESLSHLLSAHLSGLDPFLTQEIILSSNLNSDFKVSDLSEGKTEIIFKNLLRFFSKDVTVQPTLYLDESDSPLLVSPFELSHLKDKRKLAFLTLNQALSEFFHLKSLHEEFQRQKNQYLKSVENRLNKLRVGLEKTEVEITEKSEYEKYKRLGDLLMVNKETIKKGMTEIAVEDLYASGKKKITIPLNPELSPLQNAQSCYKKYQKAKAGLVLLQKRANLLLRELQRIEQIRKNISACLTLTDLEKVKPYLIRFGFIKPEEPFRGKRKKPKKKLFRQFQTSDGWTVLVGRNNQENDLLTFKTARPEDFWFHASGIPGSHVVLQLGGKKKQPTHLTILEAASLAAYFSKARNSKKVEVIYTQAKYVRKPQKARPGQALVEKERSILVTPKLQETASRMSF